MRYSLADTPWDELSSIEKRERVLVVEVLRSIRDGEDVSYVLDELGVPMDLVLRHARPYL